MRDIRKRPHPNHGLAPSRISNCQDPNQQTSERTAPICLRSEIDVEYEPGSGIEITLHDGSKMRLTKLEEEYYLTRRIAALKRLAEAREKDEVLTGLFYVNTEQPSFTDLLNLVDEPLGTLPQEVTRPAKSVLDEVMEEFR